MGFIEEWGEPRSLEEAEYRKTRLICDMTQIEYQLGTYSAAQNFGGDEHKYEEWSINAKYALSCKRQDLVLTKNYIRKSKAAAITEPQKKGSRLERICYAILMHIEEWRKEKG